MPQDIRAKPGRTALPGRPVLCVCFLFVCCWSSSPPPECSVRCVMVEGPAPVTEHKIGRDHRARTCPTRSEATQNLFRKLFGTIPGTTPQQSPEPAPEVSRTYSGTRSGTLLPHTPHTQSGRGENMWPAWRPSQDAPCKGIGSCFFSSFPINLDRVRRCVASRASNTSCHFCPPQPLWPHARLPHVWPQRG